MQATLTLVSILLYNISRNLNDDLYWCSGTEEMTFLRVTEEIVGVASFGLRSVTQSDEV